MKRLLDVVLAVVGIGLFLPVFVGLAVAIKLTSPGPILYRGLRVGRNNVPFRILKFRSMVIDAESQGGASTADGDPRVTRIGRLMRKGKLDELPQLFNVLLGTMSFVGPRPEVQEYVDLYTEEEKQILSLRPGITDWASIWNSDEGAVLAGSADPDRAYLEIIRPTKLKLQLKYARNHSPWIDLKIVAFTLRKVLSTDWIPAELAEYGKLLSPSVSAVEQKHAA